MSARVPTARLAKSLNRSITSICRAADRLGLQTKHPHLMNRPGFVDRVRQLHSQGWSDAEIAVELEVERHSIGDLRKKLGLLSNRFSEHLRDRVRKNTAEQLRKAGLPSIGHLRVEAFKKYARDNGWPEDLKPRQVQILNLLWVNGPMTKRELAEAMHLRPKRRCDGRGYWFPMYCNPPRGQKHNSYNRCTYLSDLIARGLAITLGRIVRNKPAGARTGQGHNAVLYSLPLDIRKERHNATDAGSRTGDGKQHAADGPGLDSTDAGRSAQAPDGGCRREDHPGPDRSGQEGRPQRD
jgi:hypothetical protein